MLTWIDESRIEGTSGATCSHRYGGSSPQILNVFQCSVFLFFFVFFFHESGVEIETRTGGAVNGSLSPRATLVMDKHERL